MQTINHSLPPTQCECGEVADGLDGLHCQLCWEKLCSTSWWQLVNSINSMEQSNAEN
ncbi:hypothetical protein NIES2135_20360 [Leptolyngbya boryana NIES-2135]|jgi:hypothetical protein|uniref:Uncharacterized protein n=1 Tax=Leptolyngbya boryana NIES-2135 TaxID=1973484 RepID=A0A1Z4JEX7_LEPBY|nr:hypothetical protein NIES2135_20360 [Leptolyngbya boryana NIES-2135]